MAPILGFARVVKTTPEEHDRVIAYTSQLAHVVSNAYIKSPTLRAESGFSAGSFQDLTRVAKCNPGMWASLFLENREPLLREIDTLHQSLAAYRTALEHSDRAGLQALLAEGNALKEWSLRNGA
jgi:prephenate dehydrogenase